jgi:hypothetical protein
LKNNVSIFERYAVFHPDSDSLEYSILDRGKALLWGFSIPENQFDRYLNVLKELSILILTNVWK